MVALIYGKIAAAVLTVVIAVSAVYYIEKKTNFHNRPTKEKQVIWGIVFAVLAVLVLKMGPELHGFVDNIQDMLPLCAGLVFGAPAGLLAGVLAGSLSLVLNPGNIQIAASFSLCGAGIFAAFLRHILFDDKTATPFYGLAAGLVYTVFHVLIMLVPHIDKMSEIQSIFFTITVPFIVASALAVMLSLYVVYYIGKERMDSTVHKNGIAQTFQRWLLICVLASFALTCTYSWMLQTELAKQNANNLLQLNLMDLHADIADVSDRNLLRIARQMAQHITPECYVNEQPDVAGFHNLRLQNLVKIYNVEEVNLINDKGFNVASSNPTFPGYDMASGRQSGEFIKLLHGTKEMVQAYQPISSDQSICRKYASVALPNGGFVQVGYDAKHFQDNLDESISGFTRNKHVGKTGGIIISDENGSIISDNDGYEGMSLRDLQLPIGKNQAVNKSFSATIHGNDCICMYDKTEGYNIITYIPYSEVMLSRNIAGFVTAFMEIVLFTAIFLLIYFLVKKIVVDNIHKINESLSKITEGDLDVKVDVKSNAEFISLSEDINSTVDTLKHYIHEAAARIDKELEFARTIQSSALPSVFPPYPDRHEFEIFASMDAAKEVGGDFYDFYFLDKNHLAVLIADVSGKGIPAAMFMMTAKTLLKSLAESKISLAEVFRRANNRLCENNEAGMFVTAWMGILDTDTGMVEFVNAGHNPPLVGTRQGYSYLKMKAGFVLGGMEDIPYKTEQLQLAEGDTILLYTDGLTEAMNEQDELFGEEGVLQVLEGQKAIGRELVDYLKADIKEFAGKAEQSDDITMLALTFTTKS